jgi:hypothetical protein
MTHDASLPLVSGVYYYEGDALCGLERRDATGDFLTLTYYFEVLYVSTTVRLATVVVAVPVIPYLSLG